VTLYFVNRFYAPDTSSTSQLLTDLTQSLSEDFEVAVVTSRYGINQGKAWPRRENLSGVEVIRLRSTILGQTRLWRKAIDLLSFHIAITCFLIMNVSPGDTVVLKTDPPLLQLLNTSIVRIKRGHVINWLQDIYPEIAIQLGKFPGPGWVKAAIKSWRDRALRKAKANIVISQAMSEYVQSRRIPNVRVIANWADPQLVKPQSREQNPLRKEWGLGDKFVVMYSGNFGRVHEFREIIDAVRFLSAQSNIIFLFVGEGAQLDFVKAELADLMGKNVIFRPMQPRLLLGQSLSVADIHLVSLRTGMEILLMPSKIYGILAAGKPMIYIGESDSYISKDIKQKDVGIAVQYGDGRKLAEEIARLAAQPLLVEEWGRKAHNWFMSDFTLTHAVSRWKEVLLSLPEPAKQLRNPEV